MWFWEPWWPQNLVSIGNGLVEEVKAGLSRLFHMRKNKHKCKLSAPFKRIIDKVLGTKQTKQWRMEENRHTMHRYTERHEMLNLLQYKSMTQIKSMSVKMNQFRMIMNMLKHRIMFSCLQADKHCYSFTHPSDILQHQQSIWILDTWLMFNAMGWDFSIDSSVLGSTVALSSTKVRGWTLSSSSNQNLNCPWTR